MVNRKAILVLSILLMVGVSQVAVAITVRNLAGKKATVSYSCKPPSVSTTSPQIFLYEGVVNVPPSPLQPTTLNTLCSAVIFSLDGNPAILINGKAQAAGTTSSVKIFPNASVVITVSSGHYLITY